MIQETKPFRTIEEQIKILEERALKFRCVLTLVIFTESSMVH